MALIIKLDGVDFSGKGFTTVTELRGLVSDGLIKQLEILESDPLADELGGSVQAIGDGSGNVFSNGYIDFDGSDNAGIEILTTTPFEYTISMVIRTTNQHQALYTVSDGEGWSNWIRNGIGLEENYISSNGNQYAVTTGVTFTPGTWEHCIIIKVGNSITISTYNSSGNRNIASYPEKTPDAQFAFKNSPQTGMPLILDLAQVLMWDRGLTPSEVESVRTYTRVMMGKKGIDINGA